MMVAARGDGPLERRVPESPQPIEQTSCEARSGFKGMRERQESVVVEIP